MRGASLVSGVLAVLTGLSACASTEEHAAASEALAAEHGHGSSPHVGADEALKLLMEGNRRFVAGKTNSRSGEVARRAELATSQSPYAIIVSCSDSRVGPELVFDQTLGDIFVVRTAGEVIADPGLGSIEYAVEHLHSPLIVVLGHERCGAVAAAVAADSAPGHIDAIVKALQPAVESTKGHPGDAVDNAVRANVLDVVHQLETCQPILAEFAHEGKLKVVGAYYDLDTGEVSVLAQH